MPAVIRLLRDSHPLFPTGCKKLSDVPEKLYLRGNVKLLSLPAIAIVGTRKASPHGIQAARSFAKTFASAGLCVVSGLAYGVDAAAHRGALEAKGATIAVLPSGVDETSLYPRGNLKLAHEILENDGLLISENEPGTLPQSYHFIKRNRIIAALASATIVAEAPLKSGALTTAKYALEIGHDVYAVPADITRVSAQGSNRLLTFGAPALIDPDDLLETLFDLPKQKQKFDGTVIDPHNQTEATLMRALTLGSLHVDELVERTGLPAHSILATLTALELRGAVQNTGGMEFGLS